MSAAKMALPVCAWTEDSDGNWHACGANIYVFTDGGPVDNGFLFCPFCALAIEPRPFPEDYLLESIDGGNDA